MERRISKLCGTGITRPRGHSFHISCWSSFKTSSSSHNFRAALHLLHHLSTLPSGLPVLAQGRARSRICSASSLAILQSRKTASTLGIWRCQRNPGRKFDFAIPSFRQREVRSPCGVWECAGSTRQRCKSQKFREPEYLCMSRSSRDDSMPGSRLTSLLPAPAPATAPTRLRQAEYRG